MFQIKNTVKEILEWIYCIVIAIVIALIIRYFVGTPTVVKHTSMFPTLKQDQRLILNRISRTLNEIPKRGDIITFEAPSKSTTSTTKAVYDREFNGWFEEFCYYVLEVNKMSYIKRVIALPGEYVEIKDGKIYINGEKLQEDYLEEGVITKAKNENLVDFTVPEGYIFAVGDNREYSSDCRQFGCIPIDKIESKVWIRFWPLDLFGTV